MPIESALVVVRRSAIAVAACLWLAPAVAHTAPIDRANVEVLDADTIRLFRKKPNVRLVGFNAPEMKQRGRRKVCRAELTLGAIATERVEALLRTATLDFEYVACAEYAQNYDRRCGTLKVNGRDLGAILIDEKLAVPFVCDALRCPPTPRPWCN